VQKTGFVFLFIKSEKLYFVKNNAIGTVTTFLNNAIKIIIDRPHYALLSLILFSAWALIPTLGTPGLRDWDEGIYASVASNILETGDVINLRLGDAPYFNKPPLFMILVCGSLKIFGMNEFSVRIVSVLFAIGSLIVGFLLARKLFSNRTAYLVRYLFWLMLIFK
jgi:4-amino-4-deoxy-L-arabinose transferase-like glycosyltransferase